MKGKIYLIPTPITEDDDALKHLPLYNMEVMKDIKYFVVENLRTARRFISKCKLGMVIDELHFSELSEHTSSSDVERMIKPLLDGNDIGVMSEAGVPAVADPGADIVALAHKYDIEIIPLVGPSSIIMALMSSGANGQSFAFNGYLPIKQDERARKLNSMLTLITRQGQTQIFIEAPYRNVQLFEAMLTTLPNNIKLTIASNITSHNQYIKTRTIEQWKKQRVDDMLQKIPVIFILS